MFNWKKKNKDENDIEDNIETDSNADASTAAETVSDAAETVSDATETVSDAAETVSDAVEIESSDDDNKIIMVDSEEEEIAEEVEEIIEEQNKKTKKKSKKKKKKDTEKPEDVNIVKELLSLIIYVGAVILLCLVIVKYVGLRAKVDGSSMNPTLDDGDSLWVDKLSYEIGDPKRFDVIIFNYDENTTYVKRIIGLPGERVRIDQNGNIYINDELLEENYGKEVINSTNLGRASTDVFLGHDEYFVLGDNRNNSSDSRFSDVGNVKREDIVGKVTLRLYPFNKFGNIDKDED